MSRKKTRSKRRKAKAKNWKPNEKPNRKVKPYSYLFHISHQPRKFLQPYRTSYCYGADEDRAQALLFLCTREEIKDWIEWITWKRRDRHTYNDLLKGGYITLYIHVVRVHNPDLIVPEPQYGEEFVVKDRLRPRAIVPIRVRLTGGWGLTTNLSKLNSTLKRLDDIKVKA